MPSTVLYPRYADISSSTIGTTRWNGSTPQQLGGGIGANYLLSASDDYAIFCEIEGGFGPEWLYRTITKVSIKIDTLSFSSSPIGTTDSVYHLDVCEPVNLDPDDWYGVSGVPQRASFSVDDYSASQRMIARSWIPYAGMTGAVNSVYITDTEWTTDPYTGHPTGYVVTGSQLADLTDLTLLFEAWRSGAKDYRKGIVLQTSAFIGNVYHNIGDIEITVDYVEMETETWATPQPQYTETKYMDMLKCLLPKGPIWGYNISEPADVIQDTVGAADVIQDTVSATDSIQDTVYSINLSSTWFGRWWSVAAAEFYRLEQRVADLVREAIPGLSVEMLEDWESEAGIITDSFIDLAIRQQRVHQHLYGANSTVTVDFLIDYAANLSLTIEIDEDNEFNSAATCGEAVCGDTVCGGLGANNIVTITVTAGTGSFSILQEEFYKLLPAHLVPVYYDNR